MAYSRPVLASLIYSLLCLGLLMVYSASMTARPSSADEIYLSKQALYLAFGLTVGGGASLLPATFWRRAAPWIFGGVMVFLIAVLVPGIGTRINGSRRWIRLGSAALQPSEFAKISVPLMVAWGMERGWNCRQKFLQGTGVLLAPVAVATLLVVIEPDLGAAVFLLIGTMFALFFRGWPLGRLIAAGTLLLPIVTIWLVLKPYQLRRIEGFLATWTDFEQAPYQVQQSLTTLGIGGWYGTGLGEGQQKLSFLPEANTDFVFSVVGEELGLLGTLGVAGLWLGVLWVGLRVVRTLPSDTFEHTVAMTLICQLVTQAAINVGVTTAMLPPKGIAHPLISYGGSSLSATLLSLGIVFSLTRPGAVLSPSGSPVNSPDSYGSPSTVTRRRATDVD